MRPVIAIVQARMTSTRLPGKILKPLAGAPLLVRVIERVQRIAGLDGVAVAVPEGAAHDAVAEAAARLPEVLVTRGPEEDVLRRTAMAAKTAGARTVMRITSDCPLIDPAVSAAVLAAYLAAGDTGLSYARTAIERGFPLGFDTEVFAAASLFEADSEAVDAYEREHVTPFIWRRPERYPALLLDHEPDRRGWRLVVDTAEDYKMVRTVYDLLYPGTPAFGFSDLQGLFAARPDILAINAHVPEPPYIGLPGHE